MARVRLVGSYERPAQSSSILCPSNSSTDSNPQRLYLRKRVLHINTCLPRSRSFSHLTKIQVLDIANMTLLPVSASLHFALRIVSLVAVAVVMTSWWVEGGFVSSSGRLLMAEEWW